MTASNRPRPAVTFRTLWAASALLLGCAHGPLRPESSDSYRLSEAKEHRLSRPFASAEPIQSPGRSDEPDARKDEVAENLRLGHLEAESGRLDQAMRFYERVLRDDPDNPAAHHRLAVIADQTQDFVAAERHYLAVLEVRPRDADVLNDLGYSYLLQRRYPESERILREALASSPAHQHALTNLGVLYGTIGDVGRAMAVLRLTGSEEEARAKLATLLPDSRASVGVAAGAVQDRAILQTDGLAPEMSFPSSPKIAASGSDEAQDLIRQLAAPRQTATLSRPQLPRRMVGRLPGLIEPSFGLPATAPDAIAVADAQPYMRSDTPRGIPQPAKSGAGIGATLPSQVDMPDAEMSVSGDGAALPLWTPPASGASTPIPAAGTQDALAPPSSGPPVGLPSPAYASASPSAAFGPGGHSAAPTPMVSRSAVSGMP